MVTKVCPTCKQQVPVACKACPCGHVFFTARRPPSKSENEEKGEVIRRRTERVRRERPDYFNSLQVDNHLKKIHRKSRHRGSNSTSSSTNDNDGDGSNSEENSTNSNMPRKRGRPKGSGNKKKDRPKDKISDSIRTALIPEKEEDLFSNVSEDKAMQYSVILAEINRKLCAQQFKV